MLKIWCIFTQNIFLLSRNHAYYLVGPTKMWYYGGSHDDGDDELPLEVLQENAEQMRSLVHQLVSEIRVSIQSSIQSRGITLH
jgi:hypothetical protein